MTDPHTAQQAARDEKLRRQCDEAVRALDAVLNGPFTIGGPTRLALLNARNCLKRRSEHIQAVWN